MYDELIKDFNVYGLDSHTLIRCITKEEWDVLLDYLVAIGVRSEQQANHLREQFEHESSKSTDGTVCHMLGHDRWCYADYYLKNYPEYHMVDLCEIYRPHSCVVNKDPEMRYEDLFE